MAMTIELDNIPESRLSAGTQSCMATGTSASEGGFAQLLSLLTGVPAEADFPADLPNPSGQKNIKGSQGADGDVVTNPACFLPISCAPFLPLPVSASAPTLLGGGSEKATGSGDTLHLFPAPLPQIHEPFSESAKQNTFYWQKVEFLGIFADKIQENAINLYETSSDGLLSVPDAVQGASITPFETQIDASLSVSNPHAGEDVSTPITSHLLHEPFALSGHTESREVLQGEGVPSRNEPRAVADIPSSSRTAADHSLPFPAFHLTQTHFAHSNQPTDFVMAHDAHLHEQVAEVLDRLIAHREEQTVHLRLDPPELGTLEIHLRLEGSEVHAWLTAERDLTRQSLEQGIYQLREQLASRGLQLAHFEVNTGSQGAYERARYPSSPPLPFAEPVPRPQQATDSLHLFGQWSAWA